MGNYSIRKTDARERRFDRLRDATDESSTSKAIDTAATFYLQMGATDAGVRVGKFHELLEAASERGSLTAPEIAAILDSEQLPLEADTSFTIG